jgi:hypothetical protein
MSHVWFDELSGATLLEVRSKTHGNFIAWIDSEDAERVAAYNWNVRISDSRIYFATRVKQPNGKRTMLYLHRFLKSCPDGLQIDHEKHEYLDLRKTELRCADRSQNQWNQRSHSNTTSRFKGVSWHKQTSKWQAQIRYNYKRVHLGLFPPGPEGQRDAALAYDHKAIELFGEFAKLNDIPEREVS